MAKQSRDVKLKTQIHLSISLNPKPKQTEFLSLILFHNLASQSLSVNPKESTFSANLRLDLEWKDARLAWSQEISRVMAVHLDFKDIWKPRLQVNAVLGTFLVEPKQACVSSDGIVRTYFDFLYNGFCLIESEFFPYDSHMCLLEFQQVSFGVVFKNQQGRDLPLVDPMIDKYHNTWWFR